MSYVPSSAATQPAAHSGSTWLAFHIAITGLINLAVFLIWALTGGGYFWPVWVALGLGTPLLVHLAIRRALREPPGRVRNVTIHGLLTAIYWLFSFLTWAITGGGYFWPVYAMVVTGLAVAFHALFAFRDRLPQAREVELVERVDELTRTRAGALDVQAAELRRIERDLHDGAQARLVALSMKLGRAERRLEEDPEVAELLREARADAGAAIAELRDLARGIAPPILADRGLVAAVETLAHRAPIPTTVDASLDTRPVPVVEAAAYFVVAESLTNAAKHAPSATAHVTMRQYGGWLLIDVADDGPGGADLDGSGLTGLRHRAEALDGTLTVSSPAGGGTTIHAELPCG